MDTAGQASFNDVFHYFPSFFVNTPTEQDGAKLFLTIKPNKHPTNDIALNTIVVFLIPIFLDKG